ncbi:holo-ACP synthase [Paenibacillus sp. SYP-B4298]|uniref:holo-ACP synthase n=1 Tax=Paenibacillus sp. SYP-B4298 TaxID=2996034 RepID=UPI0022DCFFF6|nr:holo-ACP synthase [Paenibacillus sp. SYP-B4298]
MIYGVGLDLQYIPQIEESIQRQQELFLNRVYTQQEIAYCRKHRKAGQHYAAKWAAKEAFSKALGTGISKGIRLLDIETVHLKSGQPHIVLYRRALEICEQHNLKVFVSISHSGDYAAAQVVLGYGRDAMDSVKNTNGLRTEAEC